MWYDHNSAARVDPSRPIRVLVALAMAHGGTDMTRLAIWAAALLVAVSPSFGERIVVGSGEEEHALRALSKKLRVGCSFKGRLSDSEKWREIRKSLFMVFPSSFEGFGMPPAEAFLCKKPCVCADIPIIKEIYRGYVDSFKEHDIQQLADIINHMTTNPEYRKRRGLKGYHYVKRNYSWEKSAQKIETVLKAFKQNGKK